MAARGHLATPDPESTNPATEPAIDRMTAEERAIVVRWIARVLLTDAERELEEEAASGGEQG